MGNGFELCEFETLTSASSPFSTQDVINYVRDTCIQFSKTHPYMKTYVNSNNREIKRIIFYGVQLFIPVLLLRILRFPEISTCESTDELGWVIRKQFLRNAEEQGNSLKLEAFDFIGCFAEQVGS